MAKYMSIQIYEARDMDMINTFACYDKFGHVPLDPPVLN